MSFVGSNILAGASGQGGGGYQINRSLRFNSGDSAHLSRQPSAAGNRRTWTWSGWIKKHGVGTQSFILAAGTSADEYVQVYFSTDQIVINTKVSGQGFTSTKTGALYRDPASWFHLIIAIDTTATGNSGKDRLKLYINGNLLDDSAYSTDGRANIAVNSDLAVNATVAHYIGKQGVANTYANISLADVHFIDGQALAATDFGAPDDNGVWQPKKYSGSYGTNGFHLPFSDNSSNAALGTDTSGNSNTWTVNNLTAAGNSNTYTNAVTTTEGGGAFYSGVAANLFSASTLLYGGYTSSAPYNSNIVWTPPGGVAVNNPKITLSYYSAVKINGTAYTPTGSGELTIPFVGTLNTLVLENTDGTGNVVRATGLKLDGTNLVTITDSASTDALRDSPVNGTASSGGDPGGSIVGNYATFNALLGSGTKSNGNLLTTTSGYSPDITTIAPSSGKWYVEITWDSGSYARIGIQNPSVTSSDFGEDIYGWRYESNTGNFYNGSNGTLSSHATYGTGTVVGIALDCDAGKVWISKNGVYANSGNPASGANPAATNVPIGTPIAFACTTGSSASVFTLNAGQRAFSSAAPAGYKSLNTANLPEPTIADGSKYFDTKLYTGNGGTNAQTGLGFSPDFLWLKRRNGANAHALFDQIRGVTKALESSNSGSEKTNDPAIGSFNSNGFTLTGSSNQTNASGQSYVGWAWDAGDSNTTIAAGSLNSSVYNQSAVWSGMCAPSPSSGAFAAGFDGSITTTFAGGISAGAYFTFTPTGGISFSNNIRVYNGAVSDTSVKINGGASISLSTSSWTTVATGSGTLTTLAITRGVTQVHGWFAIEIDGKVLVDSNITPANVPSIASTVRANPSAGFSIVSYTGVTGNQSFGHGLNVKPKFILIKNRSNSADWFAMFDTGATHYQHGYLNGTSQFYSASAQSVTSSTITLGNNNSMFGANGDNYVAYCFAPVSGYSAMGEYTGNGSSDGPAVFTEFRPAFVLVKSASNSEHWVIWDSSRSTFNQADDILRPNDSGAELSNYGGGEVDILSNGFKLRGNWGATNGSGQTYIYYAVAEHPFKTARAR